MSRDCARIQRAAGMYASALGLMVALTVTAPLYAQEPEPEEAPVEESAESADAAADDEGAMESGEDAAKKWYSGYLETELDLRRSDRERDALLDQFLRVEIEPPQRDDIRVWAGVWAIEDLDGHESDTSSLSTLHNTFDASVQVRLLHLYAEFDDVWGDSTLRVGRQRILDSPAYNRIDGVYFKRRLPGWEFYVFGGARASLYEDAHNDRTAGAGVAVDLTRRTRLSVDAFYGEDERDGDEEVFRGPIADLLGLSFPRRVKREVESRMVSVTVNHQWSPRHNLHGRYTLFDGESDEIMLSATGIFEGSEIVYDLTFRRRDNTIGDRADDVTGFFRVLGEQSEFNEVLGSVWIPVTERLTASVEAQLRETENGGAPFGNRDFQRVGVGLHREDLFEDVDGNVSLSWWNVEDDEGSVVVTGDLTKEWERWKLTVGADFERWEDRVTEYRPLALPASRFVGRFVPFVRRYSTALAGLFDVDVVETHENVYSGFVNADYTLSERQELSFDISYEEDDGPDSPYWRFAAAYRLEF